MKRSQIVPDAIDAWMASYNGSVKDQHIMAADLFCVMLKECQARGLDMLTIYQNAGRALDETERGKEQRMHALFGGANLN